MSAPLQFAVPEPHVPFRAPAIGWRLEGVRADAVRAGHFTTYSGYRRVCSVQAHWVTQGRGKNKRTYLSYVAFERSDGSVDKLDPDTELVVYAPVRLAPSS